MSTDRPDAGELVGSVAAWLQDDLAPELVGGSRFQARVAAQALGIAARELRLGPAHADLDADAFAGLLGAEGDGHDADELRAALCAGIREGRHDDDLEALAATLREHVRRKLEVARPGYDADPPAR